MGASDTPNFAPVEPRLRGMDAVGALIELLRLRLVRRALTPGAASASSAVVPPAAESPSLFYAPADHVDHGPKRPPLPPIPGYRLPDTRGVQ